MWPRLRRVVSLSAIAAIACGAGAAFGADAGVPRADDRATSAPGGASAGEPPRRIRAAVAGSAPFVVKDEGDLGGISVEVFREVAVGAGLMVELVPMASVPLALEALARREVDVAVGPISITAERAERVRFTQPYFQSSLGIMAPRSGGSLLGRVAPFFSHAFFVGVGALMAVLVAVGALVWLAERRKNAAQFPAHPIPGIANGVWFALVTMTTVGYGDRAPVTTLGRVITGVWMVIALVTASSLTAGIATALTLAKLTPSRVETAEQLARRPVAVVRGTPAVAFATRANARIVLVDNLTAAVERVAAGGADAIVFDRPQLLYHLQKDPELDFAVAEARYLPQGYGFAMPLDTDLQQMLNLALLRATELGVVTRATTKWLGPADGDGQH